MRLPRARKTMEPDRCLATARSLKRRSLACASSAALLKASKAADSDAATTPVRSHCFSGCQYCFLILFCILLTACHPKGFDAEYKEAEGRVGLGDNDGALVAYRRIADRYPTDKRRPLILLRIAGIYDNFLRDDDLAISAYGNLIKEFPFSEEARFSRERRVEIYEKKGQIDLAIEDYSALMKHYPDSSDNNRYRLMLVGAYMAQKNFPQARIEVKPLVEEKDIPPDIRELALFSAAESYFLEDRIEKAVPFYQALLSDFPNSKLASEAKLHLATCVEEMGYLGHARDITKSAEKDYPNKKVIEARVKSIDERGKQEGPARK